MLLSKWITMYMWIAVMIFWLLPRTSEAKYTNNVYGNTVQVDKSYGFHILELHGFTAGVTSSLFIGAMSLLRVL